MKQAIKVLHLSTHNEECGIAIFQEGIVDAMGHIQAIENVFFDVSPNVLKLQRGAAFEATLQKLRTQLEGFDILHIQHESSFYRGDQLSRIVTTAKGLGKKVLCTLHTPPHARLEHPIYETARIGLHPRSWLHAARIRRQRSRYIRESIAPLLRADLLIVPSAVGRDSFAAYGVPRDRIRVIALPVPAVDAPERQSNVIASHLSKRSGDVILSTVGFLAETKGILPLIRSLSFLPESYKLAIIGGAHPSGFNDAFYDRACNLIAKLQLQDRIYITGYVASDDDRDALLRETDICVFPYDRKYYDYVSSAALTNAVANGLPVVAYRTRTLEESNQLVPFISFCQSANYYELARVVQQIDRSVSAKLTTQFADMLTIKNQAQLFADVYQELVS